MLAKFQEFVQSLDPSEVEDVKELLAEFVSPEASAAVDVIQGGSVVKGLIAIGKIAKGSDAGDVHIPASVIIQCPHCQGHFSKDLRNG